MTETVEQLDLLKPQTAKLIREYVDRVVTFDEAQSARKVVRGLNKFFEQHPELRDRPGEAATTYQAVLPVARAVALPLLKEDEIKDFFQKGVAEALKNPDIIMIEKVTAKLVQLPWVEDRDEFKKKIRFELRQNYERLTLQSIASEAGVVAPTVREWITRAEKAAFPGEPLASAIFNTKAFQALSEGERKIVLRLLSLDDFLSLSSASPEGFEGVTTIVNEKGERLVLAGGEVRPAVDPETEELMNQYYRSETSSPAAPAVPTKVESTPANEKIGNLASGKDIRNMMRSLGAEHSKEDEERYMAQEQLIEQFGSDTQQIVSHLINGLLISDVRIVLSSLAVLARSGAITQAVRDQQLLAAFRDEVLQPAARQVKVDDVLLSAWIVDRLDHPVVISAFLHWALDRVFPKDPAESARVGNQLENTLAALGQTDIVGMTYFDVAAGMFRWTPFKVNPDGSLSWVE